MSVNKEGRHCSHHDHRPPLRAPPPPPPSDDGHNPTAGGPGFQWCRSGDQRATNTTTPSSTQQQERCASPLQTLTPGPQVTHKGAHLEGCLYETLYICIYVRLEASVVCTIETGCMLVKHI